MLPGLATVTAVLDSRIVNLGLKTESTGLELRSWSWIVIEHEESLSESSGKLLSCNLVSDLEINEQKIKYTNITARGGCIIVKVSY